MTLGGPGVDGVHAPDRSSARKGKFLGRAVLRFRPRFQSFEGDVACASARQFSSANMKQRLIPVLVAILASYLLSSMGYSLARVALDPSATVDRSCGTIIGKTSGQSYTVRACEGECRLDPYPDCAEIESGPQDAQGNPAYPRYKWCGCPGSDLLLPPPCCTAVVVKTGPSSAWLPAAIGDCRDTPGAQFDCPQAGQTCDLVPAGSGFAKRAVCLLD